MKCQTLRTLGRHNPTYLVKFDFLVIDLCNKIKVVLLVISLHYLQPMYTTTTTSNSAEQY